MKKSDTKSALRTSAVINTELSGAEQTVAQIRRFLEKNMKKIRSPRFKEYVHSSEGKLVRNPVLKSVREYECTLRAVSRHAAALRAELDALIGAGQSEKSEFDEFAE